MGKVRSVILNLTELLEGEIAKELKQVSRGAILHDGSSCGGVNYIGLYASYTLEVRNGAPDTGPTSCETVKLALLSCSPMTNIELNDSNNEESELDIEEAATFCANTHATHIKSIFNFYDIKVLSSAVCQISHTCRVNKKVAKLLCIPHVACKSHLLNLEVNYMVRMISDWDTTIVSVHAKMLQCKQHLQNPALLRNVIDLRPVLHNQTR